MTHEPHNTTTDACMHRGVELEITTKNWVEFPSDLDIDTWI